MDDPLSYMHDYIKRTHPKIPFQDALLEEGRCIVEMNRAELRASEAVARKSEVNETQKIIEALNKETHDAFVEKKRCQQLMRSAIELGHLQRYLATADAAKGRIAQIKLEDAEIDRRYEHAKEQAADIRAEYRRAEERQKAEEDKLKREAIELCMVLKAQMAEHEGRRLEEWEERLREGNELQERLNKLDEKDRADAKAEAIAKVQLRKEMIENLRIRREQRIAQNTPNKNDLNYFYKVTDEREAFNQAIKDAKSQRLKRQQERAAELGQDVLAMNNARRQGITNLIERWATEQENQNNFLYEKEQEKLNETRRIMQQSMKFQQQQREDKMHHELSYTMELSRQRVTRSHDDSERKRLIKRMERERWDNEQFLKIIAEELEEKKAEELAKVMTPGTAEWEVDKRDKEIEATRIKVLNEQPLSLLRYLPCRVVSSNYLPQPLRDIVREEVRRDPIPMFNQKRHKPHLKRIKPQGGDLIKCCKACPPTKPISNIF